MAYFNLISVCSLFLLLCLRQLTDRDSSKFGDHNLLTLEYGSLTVFEHVPTLSAGRPVVPQHEAAGGRAVHAQQLRDAQVRHRQLGHRRERVQAGHHSRQGS